MRERFANIPQHTSQPFFAKEGRNSQSFVRVLHCLALRRMAEPATSFVHLLKELSRLTQLLEFREMFS